MTTIAPPPNPVVARTPLRAYPGWVVRQYADGTFDADNTRGAGLSPVVDTFREAVAWAREIAADARCRS